jgi:hypothetical protein
MRIPPLPQGSRKIAVPLAVVALTLVLWIVPLASGALLPELNAAPDEAAHYVTGLMIRSYLADGLGTNPREFAERFYIHYPKVAFGIWPPLFHVLLGGWLFVTGPSLASALLFASLTTVALGVVMFLASRQSLGIPLALAAALWFATFPQVQASTASIMMDTLCALFAVSATVAFGRYLDHERFRDAALFACLASAAMLTKYNALGLALLPPLALVLSGRWSLLKRRSFWAMPLIVILLCGPWYFPHLDMVLYAAEPAPPSGTWMTASRLNLESLFSQVGLLAIPFVLIGIWDRVVKERRGNGLWCSLLALIVTWWTFHSIIYPVFGRRYLISIFAALALFSAAGLHVVATHIRWPAGTVAGHRIRLAACTLALLTYLTANVPAKDERGFAEAANVMLAQGVPEGGTALVSSDPIGEGAFIAHIATREKQPQTIVLRGSKLLAEGTWMGLNYAVRYPEEQALFETLDRARVEYIAIDDANQEAHHQQLNAAILQNAANWAHIATAGATVQMPTGVRLYRRITRLPPGKPEFEIDMKYSLGRTLRPK